MRSCYIVVREYKDKLFADELFAKLWNVKRKCEVGTGLDVDIFPFSLGSQLQTAGIYRFSAYDDWPKDKQGVQSFDVTKYSPDYGVNLPAYYMDTGAGICKPFMETMLGGRVKDIDDANQPVYFRIKKIETRAAKSTKSSRPRSDHGR